MFIRTKYAEARQNCPEAVAVIVGKLHSSTAKTAQGVSPNELRWSYTLADDTVTLEGRSGRWFSRAKVEGTPPKVQRALARHEQLQRNADYVITTDPLTGLPRTPEREAELLAQLSPSRG